MRNHGPDLKIGVRDVLYYIYSKQKSTLIFIFKCKGINFTNQDQLF